MKDGVGAAHGILSMTGDEPIEVIQVYVMVWMVVTPELIGWNPNAMR